MNSTKTYKIASLFLVIQWASIQLLSKFPMVVEQYYSNGLYPFLSKIYQFIFGWVPFSVGDLFYISLLIVAFKGIYSLFKTKSFQFKIGFLKFGAFLSVIYFIFNINWGLNYYRQPVHEKLQFEISEYSENELIEFSKKLITKLNQVHLQLVENDSMVVINNNSIQEIKEESYIVYNEFETKFPEFQHSKITVKSSLVSLPLAYMGFGGYLNPFTNEAQVNYLTPLNAYPATTCHELAHQIGIGPESEANFVGYLAGISSSNLHFQYAAYSNALRYCLNEIYESNEAQFEALKATMNPGINKDIENQQAHWEAYQNWTEKYFEFFYDHFLKANNQEDGIKSYSKMVVLLINYYKINNL